MPSFSLMYSLSWRKWGGPPPAPVHERSARPGHGPCLARAPPPAGDSAPPADAAAALSQGSRFLSRDPGGRPSPAHFAVLVFFRFPGPGAVCSQSRVLTGLLGSGAPLAWRHHTRLEAQSPREGRVPRTVGLSAAASKSCCALRPSSAQGGLRR